MSSPIGPILDEMRELADAKNADYADLEKPFAAFEVAAAVAGVTVEQTILVLMGIKVSRIQQLRDRDPENESLRDSKIDLATYGAILVALHDHELHEAVEAAKG